MGIASTGRQHRNIQYHQIDQEEIEQVTDTEEDIAEGRDKKVRQPDIMELNIHNRRLFLGCFLAVEMLGLLSVIMTIVWVWNFKGGAAWGMTDKGIAFNWHPVLMTFGLIFLYGNGALVYRVIPPKNDSHKLGLKIAHAFIMILAFIIMVIGLQAAFDSHNYATPPKPNMYTLHSWVGLVAALLFGIQWALGFSAFLFPKFSPELRALLLPFHQYFLFDLVSGCCSCAYGSFGKAIWSNKKYGEKGSEAMLVNFTGIFLILFTMGVTFLLSKFSKDAPEGQKSI